MKRFIFIIILALVLGGCEDDSVRPTPPIQEAPFGVPDFTQTEYGWIDTNTKHCDYFRSHLFWWSPKFYYQVVDASPDGNKLLLIMGDRLGIYDMNSHIISTLGNGTYFGAQWSRSGRYVSASNQNPDVNKVVNIFDLQTNERINPVELEPNIINISTSYKFLPGDSLFVLGKLYSDYKYNVVSVALEKPYTQKPISLPRDGAEFKTNNYYYVDGLGYNDQTGTYSEVQLIVGSLSDSTQKRTYRLDKINRIVQPDSRISPDGNWLAVQLSPDMSHTKYADIPNLSVGGLAVIDLREGSSTQYQVYRFFPDYMKGMCNCANLQYSPGMAWSADGKYIYHQQIRIADSTTQIVRREVRTGKTEEITNFLTAP